MKLTTPVISLTLAAGLFAAAAQASDAATTQAFAAAIAVQPAIGAGEHRLHARTEALIERQLAEIDTRLTATMTGAAGESRSAHDTQLALSTR